MRIMVFYVAAESGGAISVLNEYYNEFRNDSENIYFFVLSITALQETNNIKVIQIPWIKKSWFHRLIFDCLIAPKLINSYKIDKVLSLQNIIIPRVKINQTVLIHNAIPFTEYRFSIVKNFKFWIYKNIIGFFIKKSFIRAENVIVQTNWMKSRCIEKLNADKEKVIVKPPVIHFKVSKLFVVNNVTQNNFFYPAGGSVYKNHKVIIKACLNLKEKGFFDYKVFFTLDGHENSSIRNLLYCVEKNGLPIEFIGPLEREEVFYYYTKSILLFPSYIETVGLPLVEAKMHETPIIAANCMYAREILDGYEKVVFFEPSNSDELSKLMINKYF